MVFALLLLIHSALGAFDSFGCFMISPNFPPLNNISLPVSRDMLVESCANECIRTSKNYTIVMPAACYCGSTTVGLTRVDASECSTCSPEACGSTTRVSVYLNDLTAANISSTSTPDNKGTAVDKNIGTDAGVDQRKVALYISGACAVIILTILGYIWFRRRKEMQETPVLPRLDSKRSSTLEQLIPGLERTPNMIYTVMTGYKKRREDELDLTYDDVVQVQRVKGEWAYSANLKTGERGFHPLNCFLDLETSGPMKVPKRTDTGSTLR